MPVYKRPKPFDFIRENPVEMHFHDHDETWVIMGGQAKALMVDRDGKRSEFVLEEGDIWMVEAGVEHGCEPLGKGVLIFPFAGTIPEGSHKPGHYYMDKEHYMPTLYVKKSPIDRYRGKAKDA
jgi:oxalate decarboxylase/phosphoglucose isomerase-like protein (cupin superfamily)